MPFTVATQRALQLANNQAIRLGHEYIGTEHLLLGLIDEAGVALQILKALGVAPDSLRLAVEAVHPSESPPAHVAGRLPQSPLAKKAIECALEEGYGRNNRDPTTGIDTGDILLGLIRERAGMASQLLEGFRITLENAKQQLIMITETGRS